MLLYKYSEDGEYKKYTLRQKVKQYIFFLNAFIIFGILMVILPYLTMQPSASISVGEYQHNIYEEPTKMMNFIFYVGLFLLFGSSSLFLILYLFGGGLALRLDYLKNKINGKKIIELGGFKSYFNEDEITIWLKK